jgi:hypothetical protein
MILGSNLVEAFKSIMLESLCQRNPSVSATEHFILAGSLEPMGEGAGERNLPFGPE